MLTRRALALVSPFLLLAVWAGSLVGAERPQVRFSDTGYTEHGEWFSDATVSPGLWKPGLPISVSAILTATPQHVANLAAAKIKVDGFCLLITAERTFDAGGWIRLSSDERMSTLIAPTGLPIEGGIQGAVTNRFGYGFRTPLDQLLTVKLSETTLRGGNYEVRFETQDRLPDSLPPGIYRVRLDYGVTAGRSYYNLNGEAFTRRPFFKGRPTESHIYSPPIPAGGKHASGRSVEGESIRPRLPWVLLANYNSNGYRGVVADEDLTRFGISGRNLIQDDVILPLYADDGRTRPAYTLEPQFPTDTIELRSNIPWDFATGEYSVQVTGPDGRTVDLGTAPFVARTGGQWPTTKRSAFTQWRPPSYGYYTVTASGWINDIWGNRYEGGGTYHFWIAKRMTMATATFQGMPYPVGNRYGRDIGFAPAVPADVEVRATLYIDSNPANSRTILFGGKASPSGLFGAAQGAKNLSFEAPGEYVAHVLAKYKDADGHLWVCSMRHAGVVYQTDSPIVARGKRLTIGGKYVDRGDTKFEGWVDEATGENHLAHIAFPYNPGDVLLIASEGQGANKIEPTLIYEWKAKPQPYEGRLQGIGTSNLQLRTSNGYSPHMFPEYITEWAYYYAAAPRPGFVSRFLVAEDGVRAPYWPTSPNAFGGQINASTNGDLPGDIYRLIGGVVLRRPGEAPAYAGYVASAFLLPKGSNANRVIAPGSEDVNGPYGVKARVFLVGLRPGMTYELGSTFRPAIQIDPILPVNIRFSMDYPNGKRVLATGVGDAGGSFAGAEAWPLDVPGVYRYTLDAEWEGYRGQMPGLPASGGEFYVIEKDRPANAAGLRLDLPPESTFPLTAGVTISGSSTAESVYFAAVIPGAVIDQGNLEVKNGKFAYRFEPQNINLKTSTYDIVNRVTGRPEIKDVVHLTFFAKERTPEGVSYHAFTRVIIRGNRIIWAR